jgi:hypothetical protein
MASSRVYFFIATIAVLLCLAPAKSYPAFHADRVEDIKINDLSMASTMQLGIAGGKSSKSSNAGSKASKSGSKSYKADKSKKDKSKKGKREKKTASPSKKSRGTKSPTVAPTARPPTKCTSGSCPVNKSCDLSDG